MHVSMAHAGRDSWRKPRQEWEGVGFLTSHQPFEIHHGIQVRLNLSPPHLNMPEGPAAWGIKVLTHLGCLPKMI